MVRSESNTSRYDKARLAQTVLDVRKKYLHELLYEASTYALEAKRTHDEHHLAEAIRLRGSAVQVARRIEDSRERLKRMSV